MTSKYKNTIRLQVSLATKDGTLVLNYLDDDND